MVQNKGEEMQLLTLDDQDYIVTKLVTGHQNHDQRHKYHHLTKTLHLTLKMTTAQVVETSVTNNSLSEDYSHPDDHTRQTTDTPGFHLPTVFLKTTLTQTILMTKITS